MAIGCLMLDIDGINLTEEEVDILQHPLVGGIILFSRNFQSQLQIQELCSNIRKASAAPSPSRARAFRLPSQL